MQAPLRNADLAHAERGLLPSESAPMQMLLYLLAAGATGFLAGIPLGRRSERLDRELRELRKQRALRALAEQLRQEQAAERAQLRLVDELGE